MILLYEMKTVDITISGQSNVKHILPLVYVITMHPGEASEILVIVIIICKKCQLPARLPA